MKTAKEIYPELWEQQKETSFWGFEDYQPLLESLGEILIQVDDNGYQGDSRVLYKKGRKVGWLQFGWGSCSGCDALQGCTTFEEADNLIKELHNSIKWFTPKQALRFFTEHDWFGDYSGRSYEQKEFIEEVLDYLTTKEDRND